MKNKSEVRKEVSLKEFCEALEAKIQEAYESSITITEAEKLAGEFLAAQMRIARELQVCSLDARMKKQGLKAIRSSVYLNKNSEGLAASMSGKKPTEAMLAAQVDTDPLVSNAQNEFDTSEIEAQALENYLRIFEACHVYYRQMSRSNG